MGSHKNARLGYAGRVCLVQRVLDDGWSGAQAAAAFSLSERSVWKCVARYQAEGLTGLADRSSRPHTSPRHLAPRREQRIVALRHRRLRGQQIADRLGVPLSTVGDVLRRHGLGRLPSHTPRPPIVRYERERPGELVHIDSKKLGRIAPGIIGHRITGDRSHASKRRGADGWEYLHVAVDDASRVAYAALLPDESAASAVRFLGDALAFLASLAVRVEAVMTDNAPCYTQRQYATAIAAHALRHLRTRPYTPRINGKAERFIQTALREWAYVKAYRSSTQRAGALSTFITTYNTIRPHSAHGRQPPMTRLGL